MDDNWAIPEKSLTGRAEVRTFFFENPSGITLPLEIPNKTGLHFSDVVLVSNYREYHTI